MLLLSRKLGESIIIDGGITVTVVATEGNKIRLGITAPRSVEVHREEVYRNRREFAEPEPTPAVS